jgi:hypothetical protein
VGPAPLTAVSRPAASCVRLWLLGLPCTVVVIPPVKPSRLEAFLLQGLESSASAWTPEDVDHIKSSVRERLAAKQTKA